MVGTLDNYNKEKHIVSKEVVPIGKKRKQGLCTSEELKEISRLKEEITNTQTLIEKARIERDQSLNRIGNIISETTPIAKDEV